MRVFKHARLLAFTGNGGLLVSLAALIRWGPAALPAVLFFGMLVLFLSLLKCRRCRYLVFRRKGRWFRYWGLTLPKTCPHCGTAIE